jgi:hypothetical protein
VRLALAFLVAAPLVGCSVPAAQPAKPVIWARFDPSTGDIPTPNDLVRDPVKKQLALPITADLNPAEAEFRSYLNTLDAYPPTTPALFHFNGAVKPETLTPQTVRVYQLDAQGNLQSTPSYPAATYSETDNSYQLYADGGWSPGTTYLVAVRGEADGVQGANGETVTAAPAFYFLRAGQDLTQHPWALPGATPAVRAASALQLEAVRQTYEPLIQAVAEDANWSRSEIALIFAFTISSHPELQFDPLSQSIPLPNDLALDPQTHLVSLPASPTDSALQAMTKVELNRLDGFSTSGVLAATATGPLDSAHAAGATNIRLFTLATPVNEVTGLNRWLFSDDQHLFAQPQSKGESSSGTFVPPVVLEPKTTYVWIITGHQGAQGLPVDAQPVGALLRMKNSLLDASGHSRVSGIADADASRLEPLRAEMVPLLDALEAAGTPRSSLEAAVPFTTLDIRGHVQGWAETAYHQNLPLTPVDFKVEGPTDITLSAAAQLQHVAKIVNGHFDTFDMLDPVTQAFASPGVVRPIAFTLTYPTGVRAGAAAPVILFGQALTTERRLAWFEADRLAQAGFAVFSFDLPYHGERSSCNIHLPICEVIKGLGIPLANCDDNNPQLICQSGTCDADGQCSGGTSDFNTYDLYNFGALGDPNNPGTPFASGGAFINLQDLGASRDHFAQAIIDLSAAYRFLTEANWGAMLPDGYALDPSHMRYTGISLGGILGGAGTGSLPPVSTFALNVGGAGMVDLFQESVTFGAILPPGLAAEGIHLDINNPANNDLNAWQFITVAHWLFDDVDPLNLARFAEQDVQPYPDPVTGMPQPWPSRHVLVQMAGADTIVSNPSTERLRYTIDPTCCDNQAQTCDPDGGCQFHTFPLASHIFEADPLELLNAAAGQNEVATFLASH